MSRPLMQCGHTAQGVRQSDQAPVCASCYGIHPGADKPATDLPDLTGRESLCPDCRRTKPSDLSLPFFQHRPDRDQDLHYDGCRGWD